MEPGVVDVAVDQRPVALPAADPILDFARGPPAQPTVTPALPG